MATWCACTVLHEVGAGADEPLVRRAVGYLLDTYDAAGRRWWIVPPETEDSPRAPWWTYADIGRTFGDVRAQPDGGLAGALWEYRELVSPALLAELTETVLTRLEGWADGARPGPGDLTAAELFVQARNLPDAARLRALAAMRRAAASSSRTGPRRGRSICCSRWTWRIRRTRRCRRRWIRVVDRGEPGLRGGASSSRTGPGR